MSNYGGSEFAKSAGAEAPLVIAYAVVLALFAIAWANFSPPTISVLELKPITPTERSQKSEIQNDKEIYGDLTGASPHRHRAMV
jgi:hypothetical protein